MSNDPGARIALLETMKALRSVQDALSLLSVSVPLESIDTFHNHLQKCNESLDKALNALGASSDE